MSITSGLTSINLSHLFGVKGDINDNIHYLDESEVLYPVGQHVVCYNIEKRSQKFIGHPDPSNGKGRITTMTLSTGKHKYLAVAESGNRAQISIYDMNTKKKIRTPLYCNEVASTEYVSMCFSPDGKQLLAQGGAPDWTLVNYAWEKNKPLQVAQVSNQSGSPIYQCSYCPTDPSCVCVTGNGILRFLRLEQSDFKSIQFSIGKREPQNYRGHTWVDDRILVGTDTGDILVFENADFRGVLESSPANGKSIDSIAAFSKGFVCGCEEGVLYVFERDDKEIYKQSKSFQIDGNYVRIKNLAISPSEDNVICTLENNQAFVLSLSNTDILKAEEMNFEPLSVPFHFSAITGLDVCIRKPLIVTCGEDKSVRVWNYIERSLEIVKFFNEEPLSVAFHPSGVHILVGFSDSLRFINLLMDEMRSFKDFPVKNCHEVRFSNGGQYFAAANNSVIQLFSTYTCEMIGNLRGHKGKVRSLTWNHDDSSIVSTGADGLVYEWKLKDGIFVQEYKSDTEVVDYTSAAISADSTIYVAGADGSVRQIVDSKSRYKVSSPDVVTQVYLVNNPSKVLLAGTESGTLKAYEVPFTGQSNDIECHSAPITRIRVAPDESHIFTIAEDGSLAIFELDSKDPSGKKHDMGLPYAEEILVTKSDIQEKMATMNELKNKVEELQYHNKMQLRLREMNYQEKLREVTEKFKHELEADRERYSALETSKSDTERRYITTMSDLEKQYTSKMKELTDHHQRKMEAELQRYETLKGRLESLRAKWSEQTSKRESVYKDEVQELKTSHSDRLRQEVEMKYELEAEKNRIIEDFEETKNYMEEEADNEIDELKSSYDSKLTLERMNTLRLKDENAILKRKFGALRDDIRSQKEQIKKREDKQHMLYEQIRGLEKDVEGHLKEIQERDSTIGDKVKRIFELRKKNQELEKFKFVLDYKIKELKRQIMPRQREIQEMSEQINQMTQELNTYKKKNAHLNLDVKVLKLKLEGMNGEVESQREKRAQLERKYNGLKKDLSEICNKIEEYKIFKEAIVRIYQKHVTTELHAGGEVDDHVTYKRQRYYLERSVDALNDKLKKDMKVHKKDSMRIRLENVALIKEINQLRREIRIVQTNQLIKEQQKRHKQAERQAVHPKRAWTDSPEGKYQNEDMDGPSDEFAVGAKGSTGRKAAGSPRSPKGRSGSSKMKQLQREIEIQQEQIRALRSQAAALE